MTQVKDLVDAYDAFIRGCKSDGTWTAIKASCIMAGWDGLAGALTPLVGTAPTNNNFVAGDYDRETGLVGDGSTKYLNSNRSNDADPQDSNHNSLYITSWSSAVAMGAGLNNTGANNINLGSFRCRSASAYSFDVPIFPGFIAFSRSSSSNFTGRVDKTNLEYVSPSQTSFPRNILIFARNTAAEAPNGQSDARLAFYSIGESLDLALLDFRVTDLITAIGAAIP